VNLFSQDQGTRSEFCRVRVTAYLSHAATFNVGWTAPGSANERIVNGGGAGEAISATTLFIRSVLLMPGKNRIYITTGTAPTTWEVAVDGVDYGALEMP
jgi:hypothetical protein